MNHVLLWQSNKELALNNKASPVYRSFRDLVWDGCRFCMEWVVHDTVGLVSCNSTHFSWYSWYNTVRALQRAICEILCLVEYSAKCNTLISTYSLFLRSNTFYRWKNSALRQIRFPPSPSWAGAKYYYASFIVHSIRNSCSEKNHIRGWL